MNQAGSLVAPDRMRLDFTHFEALTKDELDRIEGMVNAEIFAAKPVVTQIMSIEDAKALVLLHSLARSTVMSYALSLLAQKTLHSLVSSAVVLTHATQQTLASSRLFLRAPLVLTQGVLRL